MPFLPRNGCLTRRFASSSSRRTLCSHTPGRYAPSPPAAAGHHSAKYGGVFDAPPPREGGSKKKTSPLSALPTSSLIRGLLINSISSKPWLLGPAVSVISFLSRPNRAFLFDVNRNKALAKVVKGTVYRQFCAGEDGNEVKQTIKSFERMGFHGTIMTYAKEIVFDSRTKVTHDFGAEENTDPAKAQCPLIEAWREGVCETIDMLGKNDQLAIKITGAGPSITEALLAGKQLPEQMWAALSEVGNRCKRRGIRILIDAESFVYQGSILEVGLDLMREFNRDGQALVFSTYQAYLKSTTSAVAAHLETALREQFTLGIKLVRGAYLAMEERSLIHDTKADTDEAYNTIAHGAVERKFGSIGEEGPGKFPSVNLLLCSHNKESVFSTYALHQQRLRDGLPTVPVGFAQLQGMTDELSLGLLHVGDLEGTRPEVYKCSTWGTVTECLGYLTRRALENRDAAGRTMDEYVALKAEARRRIAAFFFLRSRPKGGLASK